MCGVTLQDETRVNMAIRKTVNTPTVLISNQVSYTLTAENIGNSDAANVMVADTLPLGFAFVKPLPPGEACLFAMREQLVLQSRCNR